MLDGRKVLIVGAGAVGGFTGAMLHKANIDVCLVDKNTAHVQAIQENGLIIEGYKQPFYVLVKRNIKDFEGQFNHVIVAVKSQFTDDVMKELEGKVAPEGLVYSFQNGLGNTDIMAKYLPREQIVAGVISWAVINAGPGKLRVASPGGDFILGFEEKPSMNDPKLLEMKKMLSPWKKTIITENIIGFRWAKLIINSVIAPFGGLLGLTLGKMLEDPVISELMTALGVEGLRVADALGIKLEKVDGLNIRNFYYEPDPKDGLLKKFIKSRIPVILRKVGVRRHGKIKSTIHTDLEKGLKTEVEFLNGYIARKGKELDLETPLNSFLVKAIHEIEASKRKIGLENLPELEAVAQLSQEG